MGLRSRYSRRPTPRKGEGLGRRLRVMGLLGLCVELLTLVPAAGRDRASTFLEGVSTSRRGLDPVIAGVDRVVALLAELLGLQPVGHQAPARHNWFTAITGGRMIGMTWVGTAL